MGAGRSINVGRGVQQMAVEQGLYSGDLLTAPLLSTPSPQILETA
jgi:hypothetical protein